MIPGFRRAARDSARRRFRDRAACWFFYGLAHRERWANARRHVNPKKLPWWDRIER